MEDLSFKITEMKPNKKYPLTVIYAICIQDEISLTVEMSNESIKDKEFVKSVLRAEHTKIIEQQQHIKEIKIGDII